MGTDAMRIDAMRDALLGRRNLTNGATRIDADGAGAATQRSNPAWPLQRCTLGIRRSCCTLDHVQRPNRMRITMRWGRSG